MKSNDYRFEWKVFMILSNQSMNSVFRIKIKRFDLVEHFVDFARQHFQIIRTTHYFD